MAIHIKNLEIEHFRGIHHLAVEELNHVNIIAGDNNSGKTSVLEALLLLRNPNDFTNILRLARMRDTNVFFNGTPLYESFINLFPQDTSKMEITLNAICKGDQVAYKLLGEQKKIMMEPEDVIKKMYPLKRSHLLRNMDSDMVEADAFSGELIYEVAGHVERQDVEIDAYATTSGREIKRNNYINIVYLSPTAHIGGTVFTRILRNVAYKEICLSEPFC